MLKTEVNNSEIVLLFICSALFSFVTFIQEGKYSVKDWCFSFFIDLLISIPILFLIKSKEKYIFPVRQMLAVYFIFSISRQMNFLIDFLNIFYSENSFLHVIVISISILIFFIISDNEKIEKIPKFLFIMSVCLILILIYANISKFRPINLYREKTEFRFINFNFFDFIIPFAVLKNGNKNNRGIFISFTVFIFLSLLAFSTIEGNMLYSVNPVQILFLISCGNLIKSYDGIYYFLLYFMYAAMLLINAFAFEKTKYPKKYILFSLIGLIFVRKIKNYFFLIQIIITSILFINGLLQNEKT